MAKPDLQFFSYMQYRILLKNLATQQEAETVVSARLSL